MAVLHGANALSQAAPVPSPLLLASPAGTVSGSAEASDGALGMNPRLLLGPLKDAALWQAASAEAALQLVAADEGLSMQQLVAWRTARTYARQCARCHTPTLAAAAGTCRGRAPRIEAGPAQQRLMQEAVGWQRARGAVHSVLLAQAGGAPPQRMPRRLSWLRLHQWQHGSISHAGCRGRSRPPACCLRADAHARMVMVLSCGASINTAPAPGGPIETVTVLHASSRTVPGVTLVVRERLRRAPLRVAASAAARKLR
jgi:hypothetical protein